MRFIGRFNLLTDHCFPLLSCLVCFKCQMLVFHLESHILRVLLWRSSNDSFNLICMWFINILNRVAFLLVIKRTFVGLMFFFFFFAAEELYPKLKIDTFSFLQTDPRNGLLWPLPRIAFVIKVRFFGKLERIKREWLSENGYKVLVKCGWPASDALYGRR